MRPKPPSVTFRPALVPLTQHFHISAINAAAFTNQRTASLFDRRRHCVSRRCASNLLAMSVRLPGTGKRVKGQGVDLARRKPMLLSRYEGAYPSRAETRVKTALFGQAPPRNTRLWSFAGPLGFTLDAT